MDEFLEAIKGKTGLEMVEAIDAVLAKMPPDKLAEMKAMVDKMCPDVWVPTVGPQLDAMNSEADELFFGGEAGGGKSDLIIGMSLTKHKRSLILRKEFVQAIKLVDRYVEILGSKDGWNGQEKSWHLADGRVIDIGGCQLEDDKQKYKGVARDFYGFDEITDFSETQFRFIKGWNRSADPNQRCRVIATGNPPTTPEGLWVVKYWGPWLDPNHPRPARPGELRWFTTINGEDHEVDGPGPHLVNGEKIRAVSRTFIRSRLSDNPFLAKTDYNAKLAALPEELRRAYKDGRFDVVFTDNEWQVIPTQWIVDAQDRHRRIPRPKDVPMTAMGVDVAQGGADKTVIAWRYDWWFAPIKDYPGKETATPSKTAGLVVSLRRDLCAVVVDAGGGYGGGVINYLQDNNIPAKGFNGSHATTRRTKDRQLGFVNKRAEAWWRFREALDPDQDDGSPICLPDDTELRADLAAPRFKVTARGIQIEDKEEIKKRIGRSPDKGDAVVMAWSAKEGGAASALGFGGVMSSIFKKRPEAVVGYSHLKKRR